LEAFAQEVALKAADDEEFVRTKLRAHAQVLAGHLMDALKEHLQCQPTTESTPLGIHVPLTFTDRLVELFQHVLVLRYKLHASGYKAIYEGYPTRMPYDSKTMETSAPDAPRPRDPAELHIVLSFLPCMKLRSSTEKDFVPTVMAQVQATQKTPTQADGPEVQHSGVEESVS
jgi:hypothetical protein